MNKLKEFFAGITWLYILNYFILQWFYIRLARVCEYDIDKRKLTQIGWKIIKHVKPLTGWDNDYEYTNKESK